MDESFKKKFRIEELTIIEFNFWIISLRPQQPALGSLVLSLKRGCQNLGELTSGEAEEMSAIFRKIETTLTLAFQYDKINYLALMMVDNQVHFHIIPRYSRPRKFETVQFTDTDWPKPPNVLANTCNEDSLAKLFTYLKNRFNETNT